MEDLDGIRYLYRLKEIERLNSVGSRRESAAEHSWSCLVLADYFMSRSDTGLDRLRVYELLVYHDVIELEAGDTPTEPGADLTGKEERERAAIEPVGARLPPSLEDRFIALHTEYQEQETAEARFAKSISALDAMIHELDYPEDWKGWSEAFLTERKAHLFEPFPPLARTFSEILRYMRENGYFEA
ncbi:MAG: HD domain-containing protein [Candidatus Woesearchaeota archaeon]